MGRKIRRKNVGMKYFSIQVIVIAIVAASKKIGRRRKTETRIWSTLFWMMRILLFFNSQTACCSSSSSSVRALLSFYIVFTSPPSPYSFVLYIDDATCSFLVNGGEWMKMANKNPLQGRIHFVMCKIRFMVGFCLS